MGRNRHNRWGSADRSYYKVVVAVSSAALALIERLAQNPTGRVQQMFKAFAGLGIMIVVPTVMVWWARKRYRP